MYSIVDERPCMNLSTVLDISKLLLKAKAAGLQAIAGTSNLTYITNWDITSSIFLSFQVIGSVGNLSVEPQSRVGLYKETNKCVVKICWCNLTDLSAIEINTLVVNALVNKSQLHVRWLLVDVLFKYTE